MSFRVLRLSNGLLLISIAKRTNLVALQAWVQVGSASEQPFEEGSAHLLEHLLLRQQPEETGTLARLISSGSSIHGKTTREMTIYSTVIQRNQSTIAFQAMFETLFSPQINGESVAQEKSLILQEREQRQNDLSWRMQEHLFHSLWSGSTYAHTIFGSEEAFHRLTSDQLTAFYQHWYRPDNIVLVLVGDDTSFTLAQKITDIFSSIDICQTLVSFPILPGKPQFVIDYLSLPGTGFAAGAAFMDCQRGAERRLCMRLASNLVSQKTGILVKQVQTRQDEVIFVTFTVRDMQLDQAIRQVMNSLIQATTDLLREEILHTLILSSQSTFLKEADSIEKVASMVGEQWIYDHSLFDRARWVHFIKQINIDDVKSALQQLQQGFQCAGSCSFFEHKETLCCNDQHETTEQHIIDIHCEQGNEKVTKLSIFQNDDDSVFFSITLLFPLLSTLTTPHFHAHAHIMATSWALVLQSSPFFQQWGAKIRPLVSYDYIGVQIEGLRQYKQEIINRTEYMRKEFHIVEELFERARSTTLRKLSLEQKSIFQQGLYYIQKNVFKDESVYGTTITDYIEASKSCTYKDVLLFQEYIKNTPMVISIYDPQYQIKMVSNVHHSTRPLHVLPSMIHADSIYTQTACTLRHQLSGEQAVYMLGYPGVAIGSEDKFPIHVIWSALGGKGGQLYKRLRLEQALAYSFTAYSNEFLYGGYTIFYVLCSNKHIDTIAKILEEEISALASTSETSNELQYAKQRLVNEYYLNNQDNSALATRAAIYEIAGLDPLLVTSYPEKIRQVTSEAIKRSLATYYQPSQRIQLYLYGSEQ